MTCRWFGYVHAIYDRSLLNGMNEWHNDSMEYMEYGMNEGQEGESRDGECKHTV